MRSPAEKGDHCGEISKGFDVFGLNPMCSTEVEHMVVRTLEITRGAYVDALRDRIVTELNASALYLDPTIGHRDPPYGDQPNTSLLSVLAFYRTET